MVCQSNELGEKNLDEKQKHVGFETSYIFPFKYQTKYWWKWRMLDNFISFTFGLTLIYVNTPGSEFSNQFNSN